MGVAVERLERGLRRGRVGDPALCLDVLLAHPQRPAQDERLEDRRVELAVGVGAPRELCVEDRARIGLQPQAKSAPEVRVDVAEDADPLLAGGVEALHRHLLDLKALPQRGRQRLLALGRVEVGQQPVIAEHGEPGVAQRDQRHQRVPVRSLAADRVRVCARGLVAVVAVGDQQLGVAQLGGHRAVGLRVVDPPDPMRGALVVGDLGPRLVAREALEMTPGVALVQGEDRRQVEPRGLGEPQPVLLRPRLGALVGAHEPRPVRGDANAAQDPAAGGPRAVGRLVVLGQGPQGRLTIRGQDALKRPFLQRLGSVHVAVAPVGRLGQVDLDHVERRAREQLRPPRGVDHVVGRGDDVG